MPRILNASALYNGLSGFFEDPFMPICKVHFFSSDPAADSNFMDPFAIGMMSVDPSTLTGWIDIYVSSSGMPTEDVYFEFGPPGIAWNQTPLVWQNTTGSPVTITHALITPAYAFQSPFVSIQLDEPRTLDVMEITVFYNGQIVVSLQNPS